MKNLSIILILFAQINAFAAAPTCVDLFSKSDVEFDKYERSKVDSPLANFKVVNTAYAWLATNTWDPSIKMYYLAGHKNPYLSTASHPVQIWDYWCAGFVGQVAQAANGAPDPQFVKAAPSLDVPPNVRPYNPSINTPENTGAKVAFHLMEAAGRVHTDWDDLPPGAAVFWTTGTYGHVAIFTGEFDQYGNPLIITTGWPSRPGTRLRTLKDLNADLGAPAGWVAL